MDQDIIKRQSQIISIIREANGITLVHLLKEINDWCFKQEESYSIQIRTLNADIAKIRKSHGSDSIIFVEKKKYYLNLEYPIHTDFQTDKLGVWDVAFLNQLKGMVHQFNYLKFSPFIDQLIKKVLVHSSQKDIKTNLPIVFEHNNITDSETFQEHFKTCLKAIQEQKRIEITFKDFQKEAKVFLLSPIQLRQYRHRWYLFARNHSKENQLYTISIDRVNHAKIVDTTVDNVELERIDYHFYPIVGVTNFDSEKLQEVILHVKKPRSFFISSKPWHHSQKEIDKGDFVEFKFSLKFNLELEADILFLGDDAKVIAPESLKQKIISKLKNAIQNYE